VSEEVSRDMTGEADGRNPRVDSTDGVISDENKVIRVAKCDVFSGVCESIR